ncbi:zinc finger protein 425-like isoform X2 [Aricia agestis]|uniref:zinc finger protein 425-like isoform X2 n=1 Tax=Aricia agestis TaxID=91739 RepID=UPI001C2063FB|nr:zinc finger protein 425-like isoform X2 [Aricia agestis]
MDIYQSICKGCLSSNRSLTVADSDLKTILCDIIDNKMEHSQDILLCWECKAIIKRFLKFQQQVKKAKRELDRFIHLNTSISSLSHLTISKQDIIDMDRECKEETCDIPTVFVKVEELPVEISNNPESHVFESHNSYDDNEYHSDYEESTNQCVGEALDEKDNLLIPTKQKIEVKNKTRIKTKVIFNESDDEPLKPKNENNQEKKICIKKKEGLQKKKKREKPAGVIRNARVAKKLQELNVSRDQLEMVLLTWEEVELERQTARQRATFTRHQSRCADCALGFNHASKLDEHMRKHDPIPNGEQCDFCRVWCKDSRALVAHKRRHRLRWRCRTCGLTWSRAATAADHAARDHDAPPPTHACALCPHRATTLGKLRSHLRSHDEQQKCEVCGKTFRDRTALKTHLLIHKGEKRFACPRCDKRFLFKSAMDIHLETHNASAQLYCHQCDMNFKNRMSYNQHMRYNLKHIDPAKLKHACDSCGKRFAKSSRLAEHNMAVHLKLTPVTCTMPGCQFSCSSRPVLRTHIRMQHRDGREKRNHVCHLCGKAYISKSCLEGHLRAHSGERPLRCPRCPAAFAYDAALYNHIKHVHLKHKKIRIRDAQSGDWSLTIPTPADQT